MDKTEEQLREEDRQAINIFRKTYNARREGRTLLVDDGLRAFKEQYDNLQAAKENIFKSLRIPARMQGLSDEAGQFQQQDYYNSKIAGTDRFTAIGKGIAEQVGKENIIPKLTNSILMKELQGYPLTPHDCYEKEEVIEETIEDIKKQLNPDLIAGILALEER